MLEHNGRLYIIVEHNRQISRAMLQSITGNFNNIIGASLFVRLKNKCIGKLASYIKS